MSGIEKRIEKLEEQSGGNQSHLICFGDTEGDTKEKAIDEYCKFHGITREELSRGKATFVRLACDE